MRGRSWAAVLAAIGGFVAGSAAGAGRELAAAEVFERLEQSLLSAQRVELQSEIRAQGPVSAELRGALELRPANSLLLRQAGTFAGQAQQLELVGDGLQSTLRRNGEARTEATEAESNRAVVLGLTRMGLLHNVARLVSLRGPDHGAGGVGEWVTVRNVRYLGPQRTQKGPTGLAIAFDIAVAGRPAATARLWLDEETHLPVRRLQTVYFDGGEMSVEETYSRFVVE